MTTSAALPRAVLFEEGDAAADLPVCDHYCGVEARMRKSLALQAELGPVFDVTLDCEDGAPVGAEAQHATMVADLILSGENRFGRVGARAHPVDHPAFEADLDTLVGRAGDRLAYLMIPKPRGLADARRAIDAVEAVSRRSGRGASLPVHLLIETHGGLRDVQALADLPRVQSLSFGLMDFVSAHRGAIPQSAMSVKGQFEHPLVVRAKLEIAAACHRVQGREGPGRRGHPGGARIRLHPHVEHPPGADPAHRRCLRPEHRRSRRGHRHHRGGAGRGMGAHPPPRHPARPGELPLLLAGDRAGEAHRPAAAGAGGAAVLRQRRLTSAPRP
jgi:hypothetical protein